MLSHRIATVFLLSCIGLVSSQSNTNDACEVASFGPFGSTVYYAVSDTDDIGAYFVSEGTCDPGSQAEVVLFGPSATYTCDPLPLDGVKHLISCHGITRGTAEAGMYDLQVDTGVDIVGGSFTVTHDQATVTASPPRPSTVTVTPTQTNTSTATIGVTTTTTSSQVTVTTNSNKSTNTVTVTPGSTTVTSTVQSTATLSKTVFTMSIYTITATAPCRRPQYTLLAKIAAPASQQHINQLHPRNSLVKRVNSGEGLDSDEPETRTITPTPYVSTTTAAAVTVTSTVTTAKAVTTVTVANPTPTVTVVSGAGVTTVTTTIPPKTSTKTVSGRLVRTTTTSTITFTFTSYARYTPVCTPS